MSPLQEAEAVPVLAEASGQLVGERTVLRWRPALEGVVIPVGAVVGGFILFGAFCATQGANPLSVFAAIYKAAFGSWYSWQNTLVRTSPLLLTALGNLFFSTDLLKPISALPIQIYQYAASPYDDWHTKAWGSSLVLVGVIAVLSLALRLATRRGAR